MMSLLKKVYMVCRLLVLSSHISSSQMNSTAMDSEVFFDKFGEALPLLCPKFEFGREYCGYDFQRGQSSLLKCCERPETSYVPDKKCEMWCCFLDTHEYTLPLPKEATEACRLVRKPFLNLSERFYLSTRSYSMTVRSPTTSFDNESNPLSNTLIRPDEHVFRTFASLQQNIVKWKNSLTSMEEWKSIYCKRECELAIQQWGGLFPVTSKITGTNYVNQLCALCHNDPETKSWLPELKCGIQGYVLLDLSEILLGATESHVPNGCFLSFNPPSDLHVEHLQCIPKVINTCPREDFFVPENINLTTYEIRQACKSGYTLYVPASHDELFANPFCTICNNGLLLSNEECNLIQGDEYPSTFGLILNFDGRTPDIAKNDDGTFTNVEVVSRYNTSDIRMLECPYGHVRQGNGTCFLAFREMIYKTDDTTRYASLRLTPSEKNDVIQVLSLFGKSDNANEIPSCEHLNRTIWKECFVGYTAETVFGDTYLKHFYIIFKTNSSNDMIILLEDIKLLEHCTWTFNNTYHLFAEMNEYKLPPSSVNVLYRDEDSYALPTSLLFITEMHFCEQIKLSSLEYSWIPLDNSTIRNPNGETHYVKLKQTGIVLHQGQFMWFMERKKSKERQYYIKICLHNSWFVSKCCSSTASVHSEFNDLNIIFFMFFVTVSMFF